MKRRKRIGVFIAFIDRYFQTQLKKGIEAYCEAQDWDLLYFAGRSIQSPAVNEVQNNAIFELMNTERIDGLIMTSGTLANYIGTETFLTFMEVFRQIPMISLSLELPGYTSIVLDNKTSIKYIMKHLIEEHKFNNYAYISGPKTNQEAVERLEGYKEALTASGIPYDEELIFEGNHTEETAINGVYHFFNDLQKRPDVIVAGNDDMAMGAYKALTSLGIKVPEEVAITGFDGTERVESFVIPMTTIQQPLFEMGFQAVYTLHQILLNKEVDAIIPVKGTFVMGESCGCFGTITEDLNPYETSDMIFLQALEFSELATNLLENKLIITSSIVNALEVKINRKYYFKSIEKLIHMLALDILEHSNKNKFLIMLNRVIQNDPVLNSRIEWQNGLLILKKHINGLKIKEEALLWISDLFYKANSLISQIVIRKERSNDYNTHLTHNRANFLIHSFTSITTIEGVFEFFRRQIKNWNFSELYVCLYEKPVPFSEQERFVIPSKVHFSYGYQNGIEHPQEFFHSDEMLPSRILESDKRFSLVFQPLFFQLNQFGYIVVDVETSRDVLFGTLKEQICNLLERKMLLDQLKETNSQLKAISRMDVLTGLYNRRGFYEFGGNAYQNAVQSRLKLSIIYGDLDGLKIVNDRFGHYEGDVLIQSISQMLKSSCDEDAIIGRVGGDEFIICLIEQPNEDRGSIILERIQENVNLHNQKSKKPYTLSISLGISVYDPEKPQIFEELIKKADADLYLAKRNKKTGS